MSLPLPLPVSYPRGAALANGTCAVVNTNYDACRTGVIQAVLRGARFAALSASSSSSVLNIATTRAMLPSLALAAASLGALNVRNIAHSNTKLKRVSYILTLCRKALHQLYSAGVKIVKILFVEIR